MGFSRQEYWNGLPCPPPGHLPDPGLEPGSPAPGTSKEKVAIWVTPTGQGPSVPLSGFWKCTKWSLWLCSTADRDRRLFSTELSLKSRRHQHPAPVTSLEARSHGPRHTSSRTIPGPCDQVSRRHPRAHHLRARPGQHPSIPDSRQAHISNNRLPNELGKASSVNCGLKGTWAARPQAAGNHPGPTSGWRARPQENCFWEEVHPLVQFWLMSKF